MPEGMANNANANVAAANGTRPQRDPSPELRQRGCFGSLWCLGPSRKRGMRIAPAQHEGAGNNANTWASNGASSSTAANQFVGLSPSLLAPPSSPASFANSGNPSTVQSPASFTVSLCVPTANVVCSPTFDSTATMFTIGPYAHETTLVTPPAFSAFTTAPSTAPFTPPPELAHITTPSSPDVPFAQLLESSLKNAKGGSSSGPQAAAPYSASPFASPDYISRSGEMQPSYHMYPESPLASLISPASGISESGPPSPLPELEFPAAVIANKTSGLSMRRIRPSTSFSGLELPVKPFEHLISQADSADNSRELEFIRLLSPPKKYRGGEAAPQVCASSFEGEELEALKEEFQETVAAARSSELDARIAAGASSVAECSSETELVPVDVALVGMDDGGTLKQDSSSGLEEQSNGIFCSVSFTRTGGAGCDAAAAGEPSQPRYSFEVLRCSGSAEPGCTGRSGEGSSLLQEEEAGGKLEKCRNGLVVDQLCTSKDNSSSINRCNGEVQASCDHEGEDGQEGEQVLKRACSGRCSGEEVQQASCNHEDGDEQGSRAAMQ